jgi:hypothetical protein
MPFAATIGSELPEADRAAVRARPRGRGRDHDGRVENELLARQGVVTATSKPLHKGRRFIVVETELTDDEARLVAKVTQTQAVV